MKLQFLDIFSTNTQTSNFMKIWAVEAKLFHADTRTRLHDEVNSRFSQI